MTSLRILIVTSVLSLYALSAAADDQQVPAGTPADSAPPAADVAPPPASTPDAAPSAAAAPTGDGPTAEPPSADEKHHKPKSKHKHGSDEAGAEPKGSHHKTKRLEGGGRVFVRSALSKATGADAFALQDTLQSARAGVKYRSHDLRAALEVELAGKPRIKDAYVQLRLLDGASKIDVRAGQFKMPFSGIELTSIWSLPLADRGLLHQTLAKRLQVAGRAVGATLSVAWPAARHLTIEAGAFQGRDDADTPLEGTTSDGLGQDGVVRISVKAAHGLELAVSGSTRAGRLLELPVVIRRAYAAEADAHLEVEGGLGRLQVWAEGAIGNSWLVGGDDPNHHRAQFVEGRGIVAYRVGGRTKWARYGEIYGLAGVLDPDAKVASDRLVELTGGVSYGAQPWRLQLEIEAWREGDRAPNGIVALTVPPTDSTTILLQLGARI